MYQQHVAELMGHTEESLEQARQLADKYDNPSWATNVIEHYEEQLKDVHRKYLEVRRELNTRFSAYLKMVDPLDTPGKIIT